MRKRHQISRRAVEMIKQFEGFRPRALQASGDSWTIGYGHTQTTRAGMHISAADAEALLLYDLIQVTHGVNEAVYTPLNQNQFDALVSFAYSIGLHNFHASEVLRHLNEGEHLQAGLAMDAWRKAELDGEEIIVDALVRRRGAERTLFLTPVEGWVPAQSRLLAAQQDPDALRQMPAYTPVNVRLDDVTGHASIDAPVASVRVTAPVSDAAGDDIRLVTEASATTDLNAVHAAEPVVAIEAVDPPGADAPLDDFPAQALNEAFVPAAAPEVPGPSGTNDLSAGFGTRSATPFLAGGLASTAAVSAALGADVRKPDGQSMVETARTVEARAGSPVLASPDLASPVLASPVEPLAEPQPEIEALPEVETVHENSDGTPVFADVDASPPTVTSTNVPELDALVSEIRASQAETGPTTGAMQDPFGKIQLPDPPVATPGQMGWILALSGSGLVVFLLGLLTALNSWAGEGQAIWAWLAAGLGAIALALGTYLALSQIGAADS